MKKECRHTFDSCHSSPRPKAPPGAQPLAKGDKQVTISLLTHPQQALDFIPPSR